MNHGITAVIPTIPKRSTYLKRAIDSVLTQTLPAAGLSIACDLNHEGAPGTRQRALDGATSEWVAFLDDDDFWYPEHLDVLWRAAAEYEADYVFSYYMVHDESGRPRPEIDPLGHFGKVWNPDDPTQTTITTLVRTELAKSVGFQDPTPGELIDGQVSGEDFKFTLGCRDAGAKIVHTAVKSWAWQHWAGNTSGRGDRWE